MLKPGDILYVSTGDSLISNRIYQIEKELLNDGRRWLVCHLFYEKAPYLDKFNYPMKASSIEMYIDYGTDPDLPSMKCIVMDEPELAKFLLERD